MNGKVMIAVVLGVFLVGFAGISHAGGSMHKSASSGSGDMATMERSGGVDVSSSDSWQYFEATETGNFPHPSESGRESVRKGPPVLWDQPHATTSIGGLGFRNVDIGP